MTGESFGTQHGCVLLRIHVARPLDIPLIAGPLVAFALSSYAAGLRNDVAKYPVEAK